MGRRGLLLWNEWNKLIYVWILESIYLSIYIFNDIIIQSLVIRKSSSLNNVQQIALEKCYVQVSV